MRLWTVCVALQMAMSERVIYLLLSDTDLKTQGLYLQPYITAENTWLFSWINVEAICFHLIFNRIHWKKNAVHTRPFMYDNLYVF